MDIIAALKLDEAGSDTTRASVLTALLRYAQETKQPDLAQAAKAAMPAAHPWHPPAEWREYYLSAFRMNADDECGVDPDEGSRYCGEYWRDLTDEERAARLADPLMGSGDGEKDADALNEA
jgi:hypothetical protein